MAVKLRAVLFLVFLCGCGTPNPNQQILERFEFEEPHMGVPFKLIFFAAREEVAKRAADEAFKRIAELNGIMSDYETDSEVSELSRSSGKGMEVKVSDDLWSVLEAGQEMSRRSNGAFDVTIGPCVGLWRYARREKRLPSAEQIEHFRERVGYTNVVLNTKKQTARLLRPGMKLDLGGIAKGYAADEALKVLKKLGIRSALVAASGDIAVSEPPPGQKGWRVEIVGYAGASGVAPQVVWLRNCAIATSGDLVQRLEIEGMRYSHILNPVTCFAMTNQALATVIARDGMTTDSLATAVTILDEKSGLRLAERYGAAVRVIQLEGDEPRIYSNAKFGEFVGE